MWTLVRGKLLPLKLKTANEQRGQSQLWATEAPVLATVVPVIRAATEVTRLLVPSSNEMMSKAAGGGVWLPQLTLICVMALFSLMNVTFGLSPVHLRLPPNQRRDENHNIHPETVIKHTFYHGNSSASAKKNSKKVRCLV